MTIEESISAKFATISGVTSLVGTRIYPDAMPQGQRIRPCLVYQQEDRDDMACLSGERAGIVKDSFKFYAEGLERLDCAQVRDAMEVALSGTAARGTWGGAGGLAVRGCFMTTASANFESAPDGSEDFRREAVIDVEIIWKR